MKAEFLVQVFAQFPTPKTALRSFLCLALTKGQGASVGCERMSSPDFQRFIVIGLGCWSLR